MKLKEKIELPTITVEELETQIWKVGRCRKGSTRNMELLKENNNDLNGCFK
jgi:hypothetical protein